MLNVSFNPYKGYHICDSRRESIYRPLQRESVSTNGFDVLEWGNPYEDAGNHDIEGLTDLRCQVEEGSFDTSVLTKNRSAGGERISDSETDNDEQSEDEATHRTVSNRKVNKITRNNKRKSKMSKNERKEARELKRKIKEDKKRSKGDKYTSSNNNLNTVINSQSKDRIKLLKELYQEGINSLTENENGKILKFGDITMYKDDLYNLLDDEWLNDNNISFIYEYLNNFQIIPILKKRLKYGSGAKQNLKSIILLLPTFTFLLANHAEPEELKDVLPDIEGAGFIFCPLNDNEDLGVAEGGSHWSLVVICPMIRKAFIFDSMYLANESESLNLIKKFERMYDLKLEVFNEKNTPQQINGSDCGVLVVSITAFLLNRLLNVEDNTLIDLSLKNVSMSAIDARIFILRTMINLIKKDLN